MKLGSKKEPNYYELLYQMAQCSHRASIQLDEMMHDFTDVAKKARKIHDVEHECDGLLHKLVHELNSAFITPIDREDLIAIGSGLDDVMDGVEDVANLFDILSIQQVEETAKEMSGLCVSICKALADAVKEFESFRSSKNLNKLVIEVNRLEEKGDVFHRSITRTLFSSEDRSALDIMKWKEIYDGLEDIYDVCEDVADVLENTAVKNR